jgi:mono/diheme cytochrome c family protein
MHEHAYPIVSTLALLAAAALLAPGAARAAGSGDDNQIARGAYLVKGFGCADCHMPAGVSRRSDGEAWCPTRRENNARCATAGTPWTGVRRLSLASRQAVFRDAGSRPGRC